KSWVCTAAKYDVPIFTSSPGDSSIGMNVAAMKLRGGETTVDPDLDVLLSTAIVYDAEVNGVVVLGGGSPKNFYLQTQPTLWQILDLNRGGHEYVLQISTDSPQWGGLSGATPSEAISWGKVQANLLRNHVVVYADSTIAAPIVFAHALSTRKKREPKRLQRRLPALYQKLRRAHERKHPGAGALPEMRAAGRTKPAGGRARSRR
ncbi:MAG TPA: deoxyhypusine synthase family protein, partial [Anaeromyxobacteraceae bacterium]|nr:deoxyhypusine synthase family protein [Anaeromyxobacteraceae bacterium]